MKTSPEAQRELFESLGRLLVQFAGLEESLHDGIVVASDGHFKAINILTAGLRFRDLVDKFAALAMQRRRPEVSETDLGEFAAALRAVNEERNRLVHSAWEWQSATGSPRRYKRQIDAKKGMYFRLEEVTALQVNALIARVDGLEAKIWEIVLL
jgi:hypothetical protein